MDNPLLICASSANVRKSSNFCMSGSLVKIWIYANYYVWVNHGEEGSYVPNLG